MVVPFSGSIVQFDLSKLVLSQSDCQRMTLNSKLKLYFDAAYYGEQPSSEILANPPPGPSASPILDMVSQPFSPHTNAGFFDDQTRLAYKYVASYDTLDTVLSAWLSSQIGFLVNVFKISPVTKTAPYLAILYASPNPQQILNVKDLFTTNMQGNPSFAGFSKEDLSYSMSCTNPTDGSAPATASVNSCCSQLFFVLEGIFKVNNVNPDQICDGLYPITFRASHTNWSGYTVTNTVNIKVKYDCSYLTDNNILKAPFPPAIVYWPGGAQASQTITSELKFKIGDLEQVVTHNVGQSYSYSCQTQYGFSCPTGYPSCKDVLESGIFNPAMQVAFPQQTQLKIKQTTSHQAMELNNTQLEVQAYVFSTEIIPDVGPTSTTGDTAQYMGKTGYATTYSWPISIIVDKNCSPTILKVIEATTDANAELSSTRSATIGVNQQPATIRTKKIIKMDLLNDFDRTHCLNDFNRFDLKSTQLLNVYSTMFTYVDPTSTGSNPSIELIAQSNSAVNSPTCTLAKTTTYTKSCLFSFQVEAFIGTVSFGIYSNFDITVTNECYSFDTTQAPLAYNLWSLDPSQQLPFTYEIWNVVNPEVLYNLPKITPKLPSEFINPSLPTAANECGAITYIFEGTPIPFALVQTPTPAPPQYPQMQISTADSSFSGQTKATDFKKLYQANLSAFFAEFADGPKFNFDTTKTAAQPSIEFYMQDRCLGMYFDTPRVWISTVDSQGIQQTIQTLLSSSTRIDYLNRSPTVNFELERVAPYIYTMAGETPVKAYGRCGQISYELKPNAKFPSLVQLLNPVVTVNPEPLKLSVYSDQNIEQGDYSFEVLVHSKSNALYPSANFTLVVRVSDSTCVVQSVTNPNLQQTSFYQKLGGDPTILTFQNFRQEPECEQNWKYTLTFHQITEFGEAIDFNTLITNKPSIEGSSPFKLGSISGRQVEIKSNSKETEKLYFAAFVTGTLAGNSQQAQIKRSFLLAQFQVVAADYLVSENTPPFFVNLQSEITIVAQENREIIIAEISDNETPERVTLKSTQLKCGIRNSFIELPQLNEFIKDVALSVNVPQDALDDTCFLTLVICDNDKILPREISKQILITVVSQKFKGVEIPVDPQAQVSKNSPYIVKSEINHGGETKISFNKAILLPRQFYNLTSDNDGPLYFNVTLVVHPDNLNAFNDYSEQISDQSNSERRQLLTKDIYGFRWKIIQTKRDNDLLFDFDFNLPEIISLNGPDKVIVEMRKTGLITSQDDSLLAVDFPPQEIILPRQITSKVETKLIEAIKEAVSVSLKTVFFSNFAVTAIFSIMMFYLWGMINGLQLIAMTCLFRISLPANAFTMLEEILKLANFDFLKAQWILEKVFKFSETDSFSENFAEAGFDGSNFILGIGSMFLLMIYYPCFLICRKIMLYVFSDEQRCNKKIIPWFRTHNIEATIIRFILEGNIDILFCALISILEIKDSRSFGLKFVDKLSNLCAVIMLIVLFLAPFYALIRAVQYSRLKSKKVSEMSSEQKVAHKEAVDKMSELFEEFKTDLPSLCFYLIFILRRMVMVVTLIFLPSYGDFQLSIYMVSAAFMLIYAEKVKPYNDPTLNRQELTNEFFILATSYFMLTFTDWIPPEQIFSGTNSNVRTIMGRGLLCLVLMNVLINISIVSSPLVQKIKQKLRLRRARQLHLRNLQLRASVMRQQAEQIAQQQVMRQEEQNQALQESQRALNQHDRIELVIQSFRVKRPTLDDAQAQVLREEQAWERRRQAEQLTFYGLPQILEQRIAQQPPRPVLKERVAKDVSSPERAENSQKKRGRAQPKPATYTIRKVSYDDSAQDEEVKQKPLQSADLRAKNIVISHRADAISESSTPRFNAAEKKRRNSDCLEPSRQQVSHKPAAHLRAQKQARKPVRREIKTSQPVQDDTESSALFPLTQQQPQTSQQTPTTNKSPPIDTFQLQQVPMFTSEGKQIMVTIAEYKWHYMQTEAYKRTQNFDQMPRPWLDI